MGCRLSVAVFLIAGLFLGPAVGFSWASDTVPPNLVIILVDDLGYGELGCQGNPEIPTPHIDSIAEDGIRFTNGYVTASYCSPSRAGLLTGRYQNRFGYETNPVGAKNEESGVGLPESEVTLAQLLHRTGYATALVGKWHLGGTAPFHPLRRGFDEFFGFRHEGHFYEPPPDRGVITWLRRRSLPGGGTGRWISDDGRLVLSTHMGHDEPPYDADNPIVRGGQPVVESAYLTDALTREAVDFIDRHKDRPFFLALSYNAVHSPMQARIEDVERFASIDDIHRRIFAAMLARLDRGVGEVLTKLHSEGLDRRTIVVFLSDNGGPTRELTSSNHPLRGGKGDLFEGGIRVPFLMRWTGTLPAGLVEPRPVISLDLLPTAVAASGAALPDDRPIDGENLLPYLTGQNDSRPHPVLFWKMGPKAAVRVGDWKLVRNPGNRNGDRDWHLFDLANDPGETIDHAANRPDRVRELEHIWHHTLGDPDEAK